MKNLKHELQEMKFLFGYERGRVLSEQKNIPMDKKEMDMMFSDTEVMEPEVAPDVAEPEVKPDTDRGTKRRRTFDPSRLPHPNPDTHPEGGDPFTHDVDTDTDSLEAMVRKYLRSKK
jgi:hypothetical protein